jgi:uncharacterized membrane protein
VASISFKGVGVRFLIAFLLVCFTWNPTRYNYVEWARAQWSDLMPLVVFVGLVLLTAWIFFGRATARSLGVLGITLSLALAATLLWILFYYGVVSTASTTLISWIVLVLLALILAMGMSWSHLRRSWSGQVDVDDSDDR